MKRIEIAPRADWLKRVQEVGLTYEDGEGELYWTEDAAYEFSLPEIERLAQATQDLDEMMLQAVQFVIDNERWDEFEIPFALRNWIVRAWDKQERTIYGRFDLWFDGHDIKLLEFNADTPTSLLEAAVVQWHWLRDRYDENSGFDQFNSLHERLIEAWQALRAEVGENKLLYFAGIDDGGEDYMTANYLRDTAIQAGFNTHYLATEMIGYNHKRKVFTDENELPIELIFKLYPWEWLTREEFGSYLPLAPTRWLEAPWKMLLSNKALLVILWEIFPNHPLLLRAAYAPWSESYACKPKLGREGANTILVRDGQTISENDGPYEGAVIYQELKSLPEFDGRFPVCGSWLVNGWACGLGIREDDGLITGNESRFVPHLVRL